MKTTKKTPAKKAPAKRPVGAKKPAKKSAPRKRAKRIDPQGHMLLNTTALALIMMNPSCDDGGKYTIEALERIAQAATPQAIRHALHQARHVYEDLREVTVVMLENTTSAPEPDRVTNIIALLHAKATLDRIDGVALAAGSFPARGGDA